MKRFDFEVNSQHFPRLQSTLSKEHLEPLHQNGRGRAGAKVQLRVKILRLTIRNGYKRRG